jgi:acyl-CoA thioester hydrolase
MDRRWSPEVGIILARIEIDFKAPVFLHDHISVYTRCARLGTKSLTLEWVVVREKNGAEEVAAQGIAVLVCYDYTRETTVPIPEDHRKAIAAFEGLA